MLDVIGFFFVLLIALIAAPFVYLSYKIDKKRKAEEEERRRMEAAALAERQAAEKQAKIDVFHRDVFPVDPSASFNFPEWADWPVDIHDKDDCVYRQKRSLYAATPILINTKDKFGLFFPSEFSDCEQKYDDFAFDGYRVYRTTLNACSCPDFKKRHEPCKHMYRLFYEFTHTPYGNPRIIDPDPFVESSFGSLSPEKQYVFIYNIFFYIYSPNNLRRIEHNDLLFIEAGLLTPVYDITKDDCRSLLNAYYKDELLDKLYKQRIFGCYQSWSKYRLVEWVLDTQPGFLKKQFKDYAYLSPSKRLKDWIDGIRLSRKCTRFCLSDSCFTPSYNIYSSSLL